MSLLPESKTVFISDPGTVAIIVTRRGQKQQQRRKRFKDTHAALSWCMKHKAGMVYTPGVTDSSLN